MRVLFILESVADGWGGGRARNKSEAPAQRARRLIAAQLYTNQNVNGYSMLSAPWLVIMMLALGILIGWIGAISGPRPTACHFCFQLLYRIAYSTQQPNTLIWTLNIQLYVNINFVLAIKTKLNKIETSQTNTTGASSKGPLPKYGIKQNNMVVVPRNHYGSKAYWNEEPDP